MGLNYLVPHYLEMEGIKQIKSARKQNYLIKFCVLITCGLEAH